MAKVPLIQVSLGISNLYRHVHAPKEIHGTKAYADFVQSFVEACGWVPEEYFAQIKKFQYQN